MDFLQLLLMVMFVFNALVIVLLIAVYLKNGRHRIIQFDLEEYCAGLSRDYAIHDPYVIVDGKWVRRNI